MAQDNLEDLGNYNLKSIIDSIRFNNNNLQKNIILADYLIKVQNNVINNFVFNKNVDLDNTWDIEESLIQLYNDMYELLKFFIENQYSKDKDLPADHVRLVLSDRNINIYSKTFLLILQELYKFIPIKAFDIFMILCNIFNEDKIPNVNQQKFKVNSKKYESSKLKLICIELMNQIIITFADEDKKYQTLYSTILPNIFKHLKKHELLNSSFLSNLLMFLKTISNRHDMSRDYCNKFQKYFYQYLFENNCDDDIIQGLIFDNYFIILIDHKQMNEVKLVEDILKKLSLLKFDFKHSSNLANVVANTLIYYNVKKNNQLIIDNVLEIYSRLITDNLESRLGLITTFESMQIYFEYMILAEGKSNDVNTRESLFDLIKKFIDMSLPYIEINSVVSFSLFLELFNRSIFDNIISKYLSKNQLLQILNNLMTKHYIVDRLESLNFTLFYLNLSHKLIKLLRNDIVDESLIDKIERKLLTLSRESTIFQIRVNSNIVLKDLFKNVGNETNSKISPIINESYNTINKSLLLIDINQFNFSKIHGNALIVSNLSSIVIGEQSLILKILVTLVNFLKNTSNNLIINGKISYYKTLISWLVIIGLLNNLDRVTIEILSLQRNQLILLWNNLFLSSSFGMSIDNEDELYKFLEVQYHSLTAMLNFVKNYHLTDTELRQINKILVKICNFKYNIGGKIVDNLLLQIELKVFMIYRTLLKAYNCDFNNNSLLLVLTKNISNVDVFEDRNKNILKDFLKEGKNIVTETNAHDSLETLLKMNDTYAFGLTSLVTYKGVNLDSKDTNTQFYYCDNNEHDWNNFFKQLILSPFVKSYYNDHLRILSSHRSLKSKKITTEVIDNSLLLLIDSFLQLNPTIQLSLLQNLHTNVTSKNIIKERLHAIHINVLVMVHNILSKSSLYRFEDEVHNLLLRLICDIENIGPVENYSIVLIGESRAMLNFNRYLNSSDDADDIFKRNIDDIVQRLISEDQNLRKLSLVELGCTIKLNILHDKNINELKDIIKLMLDIGFDLNNLEVLKWVLISVSNLLDNAAIKLDLEVVEGISNMVLNILMNVFNEEILNLCTKLWKRFVNVIEPQNDNADMITMINFVIVNEWSCESLLTALDIQDHDADTYNNDMLLNLCLKYMYSNMINVISNTNETPIFKRNDMFELTSSNNEYIYKLMDYCVKRVQDDKVFDTYLIALHYFNISDVIIAKYFNDYFSNKDKLSLLLKVFHMNVSYFYGIISKKTMCYFSRIGLESKINESFVSDNSSVLLSFKVTIMETILLQIKSTSRNSLDEDTIDNIIDMSYTICLNYLKDNTLSILALEILIHTLALLDRRELLNNKQSSQLIAISVLFYENKFSNVAQMCKLFEFIRAALIRISTINDDMKKILNESLDTCTNQSQETLEYILDHENSQTLNSYNAFEKNNGNLTQLTFKNIKIFNNGDFKKLAHQVLIAWNVFLKYNMDVMMDESLYVNVSKVLLLSVVYIKEKVVHQVKHQTDSSSIEYLNDNDEDFIEVVSCFVNMLYNKPEIVDIIKSKGEVEIQIQQVNDTTFEFAEFQKMIYCCYVGCLMYINKNIDNKHKVSEALKTLELILSFKNNWNIFVDEGDHVHEELISLFNTILRRGDEFDKLIFGMLQNVCLTLINEASFLDMVYDYLGVITLILQKYIPLISSGKKDLYQSFTSRDYELIKCFFNFLVTFIERLKNENMKEDLSLCVLNYLAKVINGVENLNYYFASIIDALAVLLSMNSIISEQFWRIVRDKVDVEDVLLEGNYLRIMSIFISSVPNLSFNVDKFVDRLFTKTTDEELVKDVFESLNKHEGGNPTLDMVYKKGCKELLKMIDNYNKEDVMVLSKFNYLMEKISNPGSHKLILIFYSKVMIQVEDDSTAKKTVKEYLLRLFEKDEDKLNEVVSSYSNEDMDYSFLL